MLQLKGADLFDIIQYTSMKKYIYETHLHTCESSACGVTSGAEAVRAYKRLGYSGVIVTDHFFNGNCAIDDSLCWEDKVKAFCLGYEHAKEEAEGSDFSVFFGFEYNFSGDEYLIYGLTKEWLILHPEIMYLSHSELFKLVDSAGGLMVQAHPFRERSYIKSINLHPYDVHAVEIYNASNKPSENDKAIEYASSHNLPGTSGSDMHNVNNIHYLGGVAFENKLKSAQDYVMMIKSHKGFTALPPKMYSTD